MLSVYTIAFAIAEKRALKEANFRTKNKITLNKD